eukprot:scaffold177359_cov18-Tisochrysis_lutea.AAC.1
MHAAQGNLNELQISGRPSQPNKRHRPLPGDAGPSSKEGMAEGQGMAKGGVTAPADKRPRGLK